MEENKPKQKEYSNGEITVVWKPEVCIHSTVCFKGLSEVFDPRNRPWITIDAASSETIRNQVDKCPSGALSWYNNNSEAPEEIESETLVEVSKNGPLLVYGNISLKFPDGSTKNQNKVTALCRCGSSSNKPFCDGTHQKINFKDQ